MRVRYAQRATPETFAARERAVRRARYPNVKARRAFEFAPGALRRRALGFVQSGKRPPASLVLDALLSKDVAMRYAGIMFLRDHPSLVHEPELAGRANELLKAPAPASQVFELAAEGWYGGRKHPPVRLGGAELLGTAEAHLAAKELNMLAERLDAIKRITELVRREFGGKFTGVLVLGSTSKGYVEYGSDLDFRVLGSAAARRRFLELALKENLAGGKLHDIEKAGAFNLFTGLFFGDRKGLLRIQRKTANSLTEEKWGSFISSIRDNDSIANGMVRHLVPPSEDERLQVSAMLTRLPPTLRETRALLKTGANANKLRLRPSASRA